MPVLKIHSIKYNFFMNLILTGSSMIFPLITFPIVSRALYSDMYGLCNWAISIASWLSIIAMLGVNSYGIREVAKVRDDNAKLIKITTELFIFTTITTLVTYAVFIVSLFVVEAFSENRFLLFINGFTILFNTLSAGWFFQGIEQYTYVTIRGVAIKILSFVGIILFVHAPSDYLFYAALLVIATGLASLINVCYMFTILKKTAKNYLASNVSRCRNGAFLIKETARTAGPFSIKQHIRPMLSFFFIAAAISIYTILDTTMLGFLSTNQQVGYYSASMNIKNAISGVISALAGVLLPRASNMLIKKEYSSYISIIKRCTYYVLLAAIPSAILLYFFATPLLSWYAGADFGGAGAVLSIVGIAIIPISLSGIFCNAVMIPLGLEKYCVRIYAAAAIMNFALNLALIPTLGARGAACSTLFVEIMIAVIEFIIIRKYIWGTKLGKTQ